MVKTVAMKSSCRKTLDDIYYSLEDAFSGGGRSLVEDAFFGGGCSLVEDVGRLYEYPLYCF